MVEYILSTTAPISAKPISGSFVITWGGFFSLGGMATSKMLNLLFVFPQVKDEEEEEAAQVWTTETWIICTHSSSS